MNKAFCREPDQSRAVRCPACGNEGTVVSTETLAAHGAPGGVGRPGGGVFLTTLPILSLG